MQHSKFYIVIKAEVHLKKENLNINKKLFEKLRKGEKKAQFEVYKLYYKAMYNTSLRFVKDIVEAEDIMQDSFLSAFNKINSWSGDVEFGAWLKKIVINKSLDYLKKKKIQKTELDDEHIQFIEDENIDEKEIRLDIDKIKSAMMQLKEKDRIILNLYLFEGYDHNEISEILKIKAASARSQFARAKQKLKKMLQVI